MPQFLVALGLEAPAPQSSVKIPRARDRNPMTGEGMSEISAPVLRPRERNPLFGESVASSDAGSARPRTAGESIKSCMDIDHIYVVFCPYMW